ncbi:SDR family oxidoreductase [Pseudoclavibacter chungangensis]|uniref:SDR family oxidoreductase n=1 Tax=Pseudoclavibacter chungangensis TaxID=587635 RepID=UPI0015C6FA14
MFAAASAWSSPIDGVADNAGTTPHIWPPVDTPASAIRHVIGLDLTSAVLVARRVAHVLPDGRARERFVRLATTGARRVRARRRGDGRYRHAQDGARLELPARRVRVVGVAPGTTDADVHAASGDPPRTERVAARHPPGTRRPRRAPGGDRVRRRIRPVGCCPTRFGSDDPRRGLRLGCVDQVGLDPDQGGSEADRGTVVAGGLV